mmetsp:Transcript_9752/g.30556  ORF Transcript_9752/g.30556 Transcript_9752/m.30556 type:complete len:214 (+) Transcript_9752:422-1063(+)
MLQARESGSVPPPARSQGPASSSSDWGTASPTCSSGITPRSPCTCRRASPRRGGAAAMERPRTAGPAWSSSLAAATTSTYLYSRATRRQRHFPASTAPCASWCVTVWLRAAGTGPRGWPTAGGCSRWCTPTPRRGASIAAASRYMVLAQAAARRSTYWGRRQTHLMRASRCPPCAAPISPQGSTPPASSWRPAACCCCIPSWTWSLHPAATRV